MTKHVHISMREGKIFTAEHDTADGETALAIHKEGDVPQYLFDLISHNYVKDMGFYVDEDTVRDSRQANSPELPNPVLAEALIRLFTSSEVREGVMGDLLDLYARDLGKYGRRRAQRLFWIGVSKVAAKSMASVMWKLGVIGSVTKWWVGH